MAQLDHEEQLTAIIAAIEERLEYLLPTKSEHSQELVDAMRYATLGGGKRLRGTLVCATASSLSGDYTRALDAACALECLHAYSLVHDDLPVMDDAALRRGKPSCHAVFGPALATLVGDALQPLAFSLVLDCPELTSNQRLAISQTLAHASGWRGMVGGQAWDIETSQADALKIESLRRLHAAKTGEFFVAAIEIGRLIARPDGDTGEREVLERFSRKLGEAFQVVDDLLDTTESTAQLGKPSGQDARHDKPTFPVLLGSAEATTYAQTLLHNAFSDLEDIELGNSLLAAVAERCVNRLR